MGEGCGLSVVSTACDYYATLLTIMPTNSVRSITHRHYWQSSGSCNVHSTHPKSSGQVPHESHLCPTMWLQLLEAVASHQVVPGSPLWWLDIYSFCQILNYSLGFGHTCSCCLSEKTLTSTECYTPKTFQKSRQLKSQNDANFRPVFTALKQCCVLWGKGQCLPLCVPFCEKVVKSSTPSWLKWECPSSCPRLTILCLKPALPIELFFFL